MSEMIFVNKERTFILLLLAVNLKKKPKNGPTIPDAPYGKALPLKNRFDKKNKSLTFSINMTLTLKRKIPKKLNRNIMF